MLARRTARRARPVADLVWLREIEADLRELLTPEVRAVHARLVDVRVIDLRGALRRAASD
jgi:hypothetical protein